MIVAVTGHRPNKLGGYRTPNPYYNSIMEGLDRALLELQPERVIVGMAQGVDQWMAKLCLFNGIPFIAAIPFADFELGANWPQSSIEEYRRLLSLACEVVPVGRPPYSAWKMQRRNEWMVDNSDLLLAVYDGTFGGTANCVNYAVSVRKPVRRINYLRPPPIVNRDERPPLTVTATPAARPRQPPLTAEELVSRLLGPERPPAVERPESEGQRAARRRAQVERQREEESRRRLALVSEQARVRREEPPQRLRIIDVAAPPTPATPPEEEKREEVEVVRDFGRFVDLDV